MLIADQIIAEAGSAGIDANLALAVATHESGLNQSAVGSHGEIGVFQLMPATAAGLGVDPSNLAQNIHGGVSYLAQMLSSFGGDPFKAVAAYNCGPGCVSQAVSEHGAAWFDSIPASTQDYVIAILGTTPDDQALASPPPSPAAPGAPAWSTDPVTGQPVLSMTVTAPAPGMNLEMLALALGLAGLLWFGYSYAASDQEEIYNE